MSSTSSNPVEIIVVTEVIETPKVSHRGDIPSEVNPEENNGLPRGVERQALELGRKFMGAQGQLARKCYRRGELSHLYVSTFSSWAPGDVQCDKSLQRPFKQILFAIAHGMKLVRVVNSGKQLLWNRYRDNTGKTIVVVSTFDASTGRVGVRIKNARNRGTGDNTDSRPGHDSRPNHHNNTRTMSPSADRYEPSTHSTDVGDD